MQVAVYRRRGPAREVLEVVERPTPDPAPGEVRVRIAVSGVNPTDHKSRSRDEPLPFDEQTPNQDGSGVIDAVGDGVDAGRVGERVWVYNAAFGRPTGTAGEYVCVPAERAAPLPDGVPFDVAAGLGIPYLTAHDCLFSDGPLDGATVLVTGGAGAVGNAAIQLATAAGARVVTTVSSDEKAALATAAGADAVVNYRVGDPAEAIRAAAPDGVDRVVEVALGANLATTLAVLAPGATVVTYATEPAPVAIPVRQLMAGLVRLRFMLLYHVPQPELDAGVAAVNALLATGVRSPLPRHHYPLREIVAAHEAVESGVTGKVLVDVADLR